DALPILSSWGEKGYSATWIDSSNDWIYRHMIHASRRMSDLASQHSNASGLLRRALNQAARELLLSQSSDWAFMMKTGHSAEFARNRFIEHTENFLSLSRGIAGGEVRPELLQRLEGKNSLFPDIDFRVFSRGAD
ncbi:MAG: 1,4-alpha-glucan branching protein domain-containing protein, partial [Thermodesulfovibrionales bacterium]